MGKYNENKNINSFNSFSLVFIDRYFEKFKQTYYLFYIGYNKMSNIYRQAVLSRNQRRQTPQSR